MGAALANKRLDAAFERVAAELGYPRNDHARRTELATLMFSFATDPDLDIDALETAAVNYMRRPN
jgi:hypothetical protein